MKNIYNAIWVDAIVNISQNPKHEKDWKSFCMLYMTLLNALNLAVVLMLLSYSLALDVIWVRITIFPGTMLNSFSSFVIQFALPFVILNYFLIFHKSRYKRLIKMYANRKGKLFAVYLLGSIGLFILVMILYMIL